MAVPARPDPLFQIKVLQHLQLLNFLVLPLSFQSAEGNVGEKRKRGRPRKNASPDAFYDVDICGFINFNASSPAPSTITPRKTRSSTPFSSSSVSVVASPTTMSEMCDDG